MNAQGTLPEQTTQGPRERLSDLLTGLSIFNYDGDADAYLAAHKDDVAWAVSCANVFQSKGLEEQAYSSPEEFTSAKMSPEERETRIIGSMVSEYLAIVGDRLGYAYSGDLTPDELQALDWALTRSDKAEEQKAHIY